MTDLGERGFVSTPSAAPEPAAPPIAHARPGLGERLARWAPVVAGVAIALPVLLSDYPPMADLPMHEASVGILRRFGDEAMFPRGLYFRNFGHPNQLFHAVALLLSFAFRTDTACKLVVAGAVGGLPVAAARLADHLGRSRWTALIVAPVALGWLFFMGLVANILGLTLLLAALPTLDRFMDRPSARGAVRALGLSLLLYFAHEAMMFLYAAAALLFALAYPLRSRDAALRLSVFVGSVVLTLAHLAYQAPILARSMVATPTVWLPVWLKITGLPGTLFGAYDLPESRVLLGLSVAAIGAMLVERWRERRARPVEARVSSCRGRLHAYRFEAFAACCGVAYLAYPLTLNGATLVYQRFLSPAFVVAAIALSPRARRDSAGRAAPFALHPLTPFLASVLPVASLFVVLPAFAEQGQSYRDVRALLAHVAKGSAVIALGGGAREAPHGFARATMANRVIAERGGRMLFSFSESPIAPVMVRPDLHWAEPIARIVPKETELCPAHDFKRFRYVLFRTNDVQLEYLLAQSLRPEARLVDVAGDWALFESTLDVVPLTSHDVRAPSPCPGGNLGARLGKTSAELRAQLDAAGH